MTTLDTVTASGRGGVVWLDGVQVVFDRHWTSPHGSTIHRVPLHRVCGVTFKPAHWLSAGYLWLTVEGGDASMQIRRSVMSPTSAAVRDPNAITFGRRHNADFEKLHAALLQVIGR